jgi:aspartate/methionine/tyrosine aminotransferase
MTATISAFRQVPRTGVIFVTSEAQRCGYSSTNPEWCNLGQGQPETGELPEAPARVRRAEIDVDDQEYAPIAGIWELREAIASLYNELYRRGLPSQYSAENVCVSGGGRTSLTRAAASLGQVNLGHFLPDYTAYEELLDIFKSFSPIPILLDPERDYAFNANDLRREILGRGLGAILASNPCNPTGKAIRGQHLAEWVDSARELDCALLLDEFYSHYLYAPSPGDDLPIESATRYVEDVDRDPVVVFDGFTKNWRYPGWRLTWTLAPKSTVEAFASAGSFLDGGGNRPMQRMALPLLTREHVAKETLAIHKAFLAKRDYMMTRLVVMGVRFEHAPEGTFYLWGNVEGLPSPFDDGTSFFRAALEEKIIVVPGEFFDVNPGKRRHGRTSRFKRYVRFSFGPPFHVLEQAMERLERMLRSTPAPSSGIAHG